MLRRTQLNNSSVAGGGKRKWQGLMALLFFVGIHASAQAQSKATEASTPNNQVQCRFIPLNIGSKNNPDPSSAAFASALEDFEQSFLLGDSELFSSVVSQALLKKKEDAKKIFDGTLLEYDLRRVKLQRNWMWDIQLGTTPEPGRLVPCGELEIQPVYGPLHQYAVQYSAFSGSNQTRLLVLFADLPAGSESSKKGTAQRPGLVHLQVQRWTYDGRTPDRLLLEARKVASGGDSVAGFLLAEASARVLEINPYVVSAQLKEARDLATRFANGIDSAQSKMFDSALPIADWKPEKLVPVFRDGSLAVGLKIRMQKEIALNDQTSKCMESVKRLFPKGTAWRTSFSGVECMTYAINEDASKPPKGGSQFFPWKQLEKSDH
ncbi:MAG: hypothetical protein ACO3A4_08165 [Silvanigrellaceae bacterium]